MLVIKEVVNDRNYQLLQGTREKHHIHVIGQVEKCACCKHEQTTIQRITVIERDRAGNHYMSLDNDINSYAMLEFQRFDLPIKFSIKEKIIPSCYTCLTELAEQSSRRQA